jgi:hypothetical protein
MQQPTIQTLLNPQAPSSGGFSIPAGGYVRLTATGLQGSDQVVVEMVDLTSPGLPDECCTGTVALPEVIHADTVRCRTGERLILTSTHNWVVMVEPRSVTLRVRLITADIDASQVTVKAYSHAEPYTDNCVACQCREPYGASKPAGSGCVFVNGDERDPDATVQYAVSPTQMGWLYPAPRPWATVQITDGCGAIIGYASNKCATR